MGQAEKGLGRREGREEGSGVVRAGDTCVGECVCL